MQDHNLISVVICYHGHNILEFTSFWKQIDYTPHFNEVVRRVYWFHSSIRPSVRLSVCPSVCALNGVRSLSSIIPLQEFPYGIQILAEAVTLHTMGPIGPISSSMEQSWLVGFLWFAFTKQMCRQDICKGGPLVDTDSFASQIIYINETNPMN